MVVPICLADIREDKDIVAGMRRLREGEMHLLKAFRYLYPGQGLQVLYPALDLLRLGGLVAETAYKELNLGNLLLLLFIPVDKGFKLPAPPVLVFGVVALVTVHVAVEQLVYLVDCGVQEGAVMGYNHNSPFV